MITNVKNQSPRKNHPLMLMVLIFSLFALTAVVQNNAQTRSITSDDFASQRPQGKVSDKKPKRAKSQKKSAKIYVQRKKKISRTAPVKTTSAGNKTADKPEKLLEIGVTIWKLRPSRSSDTGYKFPVSINQTQQMWTAERVISDAPFQAGDRVRLAVESSVSGYLYVINREISDGKFGEPFLIFPMTTDENNSVKPGMLVDIPDGLEDLPYFVMNPKKANYAGESLLFIVSPKPLDFEVSSGGKIKSIEQLNNLETIADAEVFDRTDNDDKIYSQTEAAAACGAKAREKSIRQLERPCNANLRQLTREEPLPQTIYRVKTNAGRPAIAFIDLRIFR